MVCCARMRIRKAITRRQLKSKSSLYAPIGEGSDECACYYVYTDEDDPLVMHIVDYPYEGHMFNTYWVCIYLLMMIYFILWFNWFTLKF